MRQGAVPDVALSTVENVRSVLAESGTPMSRNAILRALREAGHSTTRPRLNRVLAFFFANHMAVEGPRGISWMLAPGADLELRYLAVLLDGPYEENGCGPSVESLEALRAEMEVVRAAKGARGPRDG